MFNMKKASAATDSDAGVPDAQWTQMVKPAQMG